MPLELDWLQETQGQIDNLFHADRGFRAVRELVYTKSP